MNAAALDGLRKRARLTFSLPLSLATVDGFPPENLPFQLSYSS